MTLANCTRSVSDYFKAEIKNDSALRCFGDVDNADYSGFDSNLSKYMNEKAISEMVKVNSEITDILGKFKISIKINLGILNNLKGHHLAETKNIAMGITKYLPESFKEKVNKKALTEATCLHDIAKVIIPENIINKPGKLDEHELEIMKEHARLSYEMLKTTDLDKETLDLIKEHHHVHATNPNARPNEVENINLQILSIADIYSALRETRSYKKALSKKEALGILKKDVDSGKFHVCVYNALVDYSKNDEPEASNAKNSKWKIFNFKFANSFRS